ncbi:exosome non-catalytic core subunit rrp40 [Basidiobolus ranarum]|uniref:Ribosomal RNA-processing protein 40 n=1 Tax=Basidiobolus ranarum TaxID=34480 RepID=A0ABR2WBD8_9FUNG
MSIEEAQLKIVLPGDIIPADEPSEENEEKPIIRLGPGLIHAQDSVVSVSAGILQHHNVGNRWWVDNNKRRYVPALGEPVIGIITGKHAESYRVDIGSAQPAMLPALAFEGATKRNRPNLNVGSLVYARVSLANKDMEPELECVNPTSGKSEGYGELKDGFMFKCSLGLCRKLLNPKSPVLVALGSHFPFETAVGMNGRVWVNSTDTQHIILLTNAIKNSEYLNEKQIKEMVKELVHRL